MTQRRLRTEPETPRLIFVSDVHLGSREDPKLFLFIKFLKSLHQNLPTHLFLLGDIFDLWIAHHDYFLKEYAEVIEALRELEKKGVEVHYFEGNHDLYLRHFWQKVLGFQVHEGAFSFVLKGMRFRLEHGDQMDPSDRGYRFLRWFLRTPALKWMAPRLPSSLVVKIGEWASHHSRDYTSHKKVSSRERSETIFIQHVQEQMEHDKVDVVISGHIHERFDLNLNGGKAVNLGTWLKHPCYWYWTPQSSGFVEVQ